MIRILFVCHGNICRSPMAEFIFRNMVKRAGLEGEIEVASAGVSSEELGNDVYPSAQRKLRAEGIPFEHRRARQIGKQDYQRYDLLIGMESRHAAAMRRAFGGDSEGKICCLLDFTGHPRDISDPWYTGNFDSAYSDIHLGCQALFTKLKQK